MAQIITNNSGGGGKGEKYIAGQDIAISGGLQTDTGSGSISVSGAISLDGVIAYGGAVQNGTPTPTNPVDIECNNGVLKVNNGVVYADGTQETISDGTNTANAEMLLAISSDRDEQNLINGKITRKVKALVLDGTEGWTLTSSPLGNIFKADILDDNMFSWLICTHFKNSSPLEDNIVYKSAGLPTLQIRYDTATSVEEFIQFLENENTNGTPVIVLYSLNTPTKESVAGQTLALTDGGGTFTITDAQITPLNIGVSYRIPGNIIDFTNETGYITEADLPDFSTYQLKSNMVTSLDSADNDHYPTAKAVKDAITSSGGGDVSGPASSTDEDVAVFDGDTGKIIKDSGVKLSSKLDASALSDNNYGGAWENDNTHTPTKRVLYDKIHTMDVEIGNKAADTSVVKLTGNQTINGTKTFGTSPVVPSKTADATNTGTAIATEAQVYNVEQKIPSVIDDLTSTSSASALSANQGKVLDDKIAALFGLGKFLSLWDATTGQPISFPLQTPYTYTTGDYFLVETISSATPPVNYKPTGSSYTGTASSTAETEELEVGDIYIYDGTNWLLQLNHGKTVSFSEIAGQPTDNANLSAALSAKANDNEVVKLTGDQTIAGTKTFSTSPVVPSKTADATNTGTAIATEAQVYKKQDALTLPATPTQGNLVTWGADNETLTDGGAVPTVPTNVSSFVNDAGYLTSETVVSGDSGTTYTIKVSNSEPGAGTPATTITFVTA